MARRGSLEPKLKVWVVLGGRVKFGDGRAQRLERIEALGSLKQAVAGTGMSYRAAGGCANSGQRRASCSSRATRGAAGPA